MKLPIEWLREHVKTPLTDDELAHRLTMAGLEVEETTDSEDGLVYHTKVTPNRGDWMSVLGVAREAASAVNVPLTWSSNPLPDENADVQRWAGVLVTDAKLCPRYAGKVIRNVTVGQSPEWMQKRLLGAGMRPLNVVVDVTNYVMLELGQPLHAFDYDTIPEGKIIVRLANDGETIKTLDGTDRVLTNTMLAICDREHPIAIAGVMGGSETEVTASTKHIFLESAHFDAGVIRRTAKALSLSTEASYRFERYVDPELATIALERAAELLAELAGGEVVLGRLDLYPNTIAAKTISVRPARVNAILGTDLTEETIVDSLRRLGLFVDATTEPLSVTVPTFRPDLVKEIDIIEEVGRVIGYENLPETLPRTGGLASGDAPQGAFAQQLRSLLSGLGLQEVLTHSLAAPSPFEDPTFADRRVNIRLALSAELSGLRQSILPNLLDVLARNLRQRQSDVRIFEVGKVFDKGPSEGLYVETRHVAAVLTGSAQPHAWDSTTTTPIDFFVGKGLIEALASLLHLPVVTFTPTQRQLMHPGRCASVAVAGKTIGYVAELDPNAVSSELDVPAGIGRVCAFEFDADALLAVVSDVRRYTPLPRYPAQSRDLAVVVDLSTHYAQIEDAARSVVDPSILESITLQSIYTGERVAAGKKSVAVRLTFRASDRTLTDVEVDGEIDKALAILTERLKAERR